MADLHSPSAHVGEHDAPGLPNRLNVLVGEQDHIVGAKTRNNEHKEAADATGQAYRGVVEADRTAFHLMGLLVDVGHLDFVGFVEAFGQVAHEDGSVIADDDVAGAELPDDPSDANALEDGIEVAAVEAPVEEPDGVETDAGEHLQHGASDEVVEIAVLGKHGGVGLLPQGEVLVFVIRGLYLDGRETGVDDFVRIAGVSNGVEILEVLAVSLDDIGRVHRDEGHIVRGRRDQVEPGVSPLFESCFRVGELVVELPGLLAKRSPALQCTDDVADLAAAGLADPDDAICGELGFLRAYSCFFGDFLDIPAYLPDSSSHQTPPFVHSIAIGFLVHQQCMKDGRICNFSAFSSRGQLARAVSADGAKRKLQSNLTGKKMFLLVKGLKRLNILVPFF
jgi:hypothetical protein